MKIGLYSNNVIIKQEKMEIDALIGEAQMEKVLDIILTSLSLNMDAKYKGFLLAMEKSDDALLQMKAKELAKELGKCFSIIAI